MDTTYDVRVYKTEVYRGKRTSSHTVRWKTAQRAWRRTFRNAAQADVFRAELLAAARKGEAFNVATGEPVSWQRDDPGMTWYEFTCAYVDMKWKVASAKYRRAIAQALTSAAPPMLAAASQHDSRDLRSALANWAYNTRHRNQAPEDAADILSWLRDNTRPVSDLADVALSRRVLEAATSRLDGARAAPASVRRNRAVLINALDYAVELGLLDENPVKHLKWRAPKLTGEVDRRVVINPAQARALLAAVRAQQPSGPRLVAFFGVLYYSGLRPEEAVCLRRRDLLLPGIDDNQVTGALSEQWSELNLRAARPDVGKQWTDDGSGRDKRGLKHRAEGESGGYRARHRLPSCCASTSPSSAATPRTYCSGVHKVGRSRPSPTAASGIGRGDQPLRPKNTVRFWLFGPTTSAMRACPRGSMREWLPRRSPSGQATV